MSTTLPLYIFDLDGTLALIEHRRHFVENRANRWDEFHAACVDDKPNDPIIRIMHALEDSGADIWIFSGRSDAVRKETLEWLHQHTAMEWDLSHRMVVMRTAGDYTPDHVLKRRWYDMMSPFDKARLVAVFDDRDRLVAMWRSLGITCLQVAPGNF